MLTHCKNISIHDRINNICTAWMPIHCKNNAIHYTINNICTARMLIHCNNNAIHYKINNICTARMRIHCTATFIYPSPNGNLPEQDLFKMQEFFAAACKRIFTLCNSSLDKHVKYFRRIPSLATIELPDAMGFTPRPRFKCPEHVSANLLHLVRNNGANRYCTKLGNSTFKLPTWPMWAPRFAGVHRRIRCKSSPPIERTIAHLLDQIQRPTRLGPRLGLTVQQLNKEELTPDELVIFARVKSQGKPMQTRERKRLISNRDAKIKGRHHINPLQMEDTSMTCKWCDLVTEVGQFSKWTASTGTLSQCYGPEAPRKVFIELHGRNDSIDVHNQTATRLGLHDIDKLDVTTKAIRCSQCSTTMPLDGPNLLKFRKLACKGSTPTPPSSL